MPTKANASEQGAFIPPTEVDLYLLNEGTHTRLYDRFGAHPGIRDGVAGAYFSVWAPNAERVSVVGDFNGWNDDVHPLHASGSSGVWQGFVRGAEKGAHYKYRIFSRHNGYRVDKADPLGFLHQRAPETASVVWDLDYDWGDSD